MLLEQNWVRIRSFPWGKYQGSSCRFPLFGTTWGHLSEVASAPISPTFGFDLALAYLLVLSIWFFRWEVLSNPGSIYSGLPMCHTSCQLLRMWWWIRIKSTYYVPGILLGHLYTCFSLTTIQWGRGSHSPLQMRNSRTRELQRFAQGHTAHKRRAEKFTWVVPNPMVISTPPFSSERWGMPLGLCGYVWTLPSQFKAPWYFNHSL